ncbi:MAG TPA: hypothetical protein VI197_28415 [Polyangiaceae bacterium]
MRTAGALVLLLATYGLLAGCTNDYDDLAYVPEARRGPANSCDDNGDCAGDAVCRGGACSCLGEGPCSAGETCCAPDGCLNLDSDEQNCGECGEACPGGLSCNGGVCAP